VGHTGQDTFVLILTFKQLKIGERFRWLDEHGNRGDAFVWEKESRSRHISHWVNSKQVGSGAVEEVRWTADADRVERAS